MADDRGAIARFELAGALETERLLLRPFTAEDLDALRSYQSREDVTRFLYWGARTDAEVREALERKIASVSIGSEGDTLALAIVPKASGRLVGDIVLHLISEEHRTAEVGFIVHPDHQGHGYAREATRAMIRVAFEELGLHRVMGSLDARNVASARVLAGAGMRREAHLVENEFVRGEWQSEVIYAILRREWLAH